MDSKPTGPGYGSLPTELLTECHHNSILMLNVRCVCGRISLSDLIQGITWVVVYSSVRFNINAKYNDRSAVCLYTVKGWGVMSCVCGMSFLCGSATVESITATSRHLRDTTINRPHTTRFLACDALRLPYDRNIVTISRSVKLFTILKHQ